jgi:hypothetical protein
MRRCSLALIVTGLWVTVGAADLAAQDTEPCASAEARQFDFWVGEWDVSWEDGHGTNVIASILDGCVIEENFTGHMADGTVFRGKSVSTYNARRGRWQQTWVDNQGGYLDFVGGMEGDRMILQRQAERDGQAFIQRMVWYDIEEDRLEWSWERSDDGGETWSVLWRIAYERRQP